MKRIKKTSIRLSYPEVSPKKHENRFELNLVYTEKSRRLRKIRNVVAIYNGLLFKNLKLVPKSVMNLTGRKDNTFYLKFWRHAIEVFLVSKFGKSLELTKIKEEPVGMVHGPWFNYFFWVTEYLPKALRLIESNKNLKLIYPEGWDNIPYVKDSLSFIPNKSLFKIPDSSILSFTELHILDSRQYSNIFIKEDINLVRSVIPKNILVGSSLNNAKKRVYITRRNAKRRKVSNEDKLIELLDKYGFETHCFENKSFDYQVKLLSQTEIVVSVHGAALTNMIWMSPGSKVIELNAKPSKEELRISYWRLANACDHKYFLCNCNQENPENLDSYDLNIQVDLANLEKIISLI